MKPPSPVIPGQNFPELIIAEHQDEYHNLPAISVSPGIIITRWELTFWERIRLFFGGSVYLWVWSFGKPLQPVLLETKTPELLSATASPK